MRKLFSLLLGFALTMPAVGLVGCDTDQDMLETETPTGEEVEIERDTETGALEVDE